MKSGVCSDGPIAVRKKNLKKNYDLKQNQNCTTAKQTTIVKKINNLSYDDNNVGFIKRYFSS